MWQFLSLLSWPRTCLNSMRFVRMLNLRCLPPLLMQSMQNSTAPAIAADVGVPTASSHLGGHHAVEVEVRAHLAICPQLLLEVLPALLGCGGNGCSTHTLIYIHTYICIYVYVMIQHIHVYQVSDTILSQEPQSSTVFRCEVSSARGVC